MLTYSFIEDPDSPAFYLSNRKLPKQMNRKYFWRETKKQVELKNTQIEWGNSRGGVFLSIAEYNSLNCCFKTHSNFISFFQYGVNKIEILSNALVKKWQKIKMIKTHKHRK